MRGRRGRVSCGLFLECARCVAIIPWVLNAEFGIYGLEEIDDDAFEDAHRHRVAQEVEGPPLRRGPLDVLSVSMGTRAFVERERASAGGEPESLPEALGECGADDACFGTFRPVLGCVFIDDIVACEKVWATSAHGVRD